ncbi:hypothetical protein HOR18_gp115 [Staphylococcus phage vB_SscM-1]|uniref:Virion component n=2 Tax=Sciuriunavirus SscM1 TaxID=2734053 RepID=A0A1X9I9T6_9CAUD|nr:hypothetical protein HOR18_gp115 [Staphylococcus phage vB_SscM-1]ANT44778.1 hypothetical protein vB_SscM-1_114 [Staphylococcus phage vB_SscM-1]ANT44980.1 hypothetical protein vB_SscM-2_113 [Staphylococcus phage vB_SscM-2]
MEHKVEQTSGLLRFLNSIQTDGSSIQYNILDEETTFVSKFYTPNLQLSELSKKVLYDIQNNNIKTAEQDFNIDSMVNKIEKTTLKVQAPRIYRIMQNIVLEAYAIINCFLENPESLKYLTSTDIMIARENINYIADFLSDYDEYRSVITDLRELEICFGYLEYQLPLIKKESEV